MRLMSYQLEFLLIINKNQNKKTLLIIKLVKFDWSITSIKSREIRIENDIM